MNKINISESMFPSSNKGFYQVSHGGSALTTGRAFSNGAAVSISGKTGTAEVMWQVAKKPTITEPKQPSDEPSNSCCLLIEAAHEKRREHDRIREVTVGDVR